MEVQFEIWIGLFTVDIQDVRGKIYLDGANGGFVNILGLAKSKDEFLTIAGFALSGIGMIINESEDIELLNDRVSRIVNAGYLIDLASTLDINNRVVFGNFHTY
jgi:hypothetical protein